MKKIRIEQIESSSLWPSSSYAISASYAENVENGGCSFTGSDFYIPMFSQSGETITSSIISQSGDVIKVAGTLDVSSSIYIGTPDDGDYTDGFFDTFTRTTPLSDAIDDISEAFLLLAPAKASILTGNDLSCTAPSIFSAKISDGLASDWYVDYVAGNIITTAVSTTTATLLTPNISTTFRAGKASDISASLNGGVSASRADGVSDFGVINNRPLVDGIGATGIIEITAIDEYNTFWAKANAKINDTLTQTGSVKYKISADNNAGETNAYQLFYCGDSFDFPAQSFLSSPTDGGVGAEYLSYLSGVEYYTTNTTFTSSFTAQNMFNPVYYIGNQTMMASNYTGTTYVNAVGTPNNNDLLEGPDTTITLLSGKQSSFDSVGTGTITLFKAGKSNISDTFNLGSKPINSKGTTSIIGDTCNEYFDDEAKRWSDLQTITFNSGSALVDGDLQVQNGRLICGVYGDYVAHVSGSGLDQAQYIREITPDTTYRQSGDCEIKFYSGAFGETISEWGGLGKLQLALVMDGDIVSATSASQVYDLGRAFGNDSGGIKGARTSIETENQTTYKINWSLGTNSTELGKVILWAKYKSCEATDYLTEIELNYTT